MKHNLEEENKSLKKALKNIRHDLLHINKSCLCKRFSRWKEYRGFDYGETHPKLGKASSGSRWVIPSEKAQSMIVYLDKELKKYESSSLTKEI